MTQTLNLFRPLAVEPEHAALLLDTSLGVIDKLIEQGKLDVVRVGLTPRVLMVSLERYLMAQLDNEALDRLAEHAARMTPRPWWATRVAASAAAAAE